MDRPEFDNASALEAHREVLEESIARTRTLIGTIDKTLKHVKGNQSMASEEMFAGFTVSAGKARFDEQIQLGGEPIDCKVSSQDTQGAMSVFEFTGIGGGPRHLHYEQDEWIYVLRGEIEIEMGNERRRLGPGESAFFPRKVAHAWASVDEHQQTRIINVYQPSGRIEDFFRHIGTYNGGKLIHEAMSFDQFQRFFEEHGMDVVGPPLIGNWKVDEERRMVRIS